MNAGYTRFKRTIADFSIGNVVAGGGGVWRAREFACRRASPDKMVLFQHHQPPRK